MAPGTYGNYEEACDRMAVGTMRLGTITVSWDLRSILAERRKRELIEGRLEHFIVGDRIIMPKFGII